MRITRLPWFLAVLFLMVVGPVFTVTMVIAIHTELKSKQESAGIEMAFWDRLKLAIAHTIEELSHMSWS